MQTKKILSGLGLLMLFALAVSGRASRVLLALGVSPDAVQLGSSLIDLAQFGPLFILLLRDERRAKKAATRIKIVLEAGSERLELAYSPPRREVETRAGLFGVLGAIAGSRRFSLGPQLLQLAGNGELEKMVEGMTDEIVIPCADAELEEFKLDNEAYMRGEVRKIAQSAAPQVAPK